MRSRAEPDPAPASGPGWRPDRRQLGHAALALAGAHVLAPVQAAKPFARGFGVNFFDLFYGRLGSPQTARGIDRLRPLADLGIPFVRFSASPFWPAEWQRLLQAQRSRYFDLLDEIFDAAKTVGMGLVPTLFWYPPAVSDLMGEPASAWADSGSQTQAFMRRHVADVVGRYRGNSSVLAWEFGNEFNSYADLPNALQWWPRVAVEMGTPAERTRADMLTAGQCSKTYELFAAEVHRSDAKASVSSGADVPSRASVALSAIEARGDEIEGFKRAVTKAAPIGVDVLSIHMYADKFDGLVARQRVGGYREVLESTVAVSRALGKKTFVGEFGIPRIREGLADERAFRSMLDALVDSGVDYAALWVYDFKSQAAEWSVSLSNERAWVLKALAIANRGLR